MTSTLVTGRRRWRRERGCRDGQVDAHGQPAAGGALGGELPADGVDEAFGDGEAEADTAAGVLVAELLERFEDVVRWSGGMPGPVVDDPDGRLSRRGRRRSGWAAGPAGE